MTAKAYYSLMFLVGIVGTGLVAASLFLTTPKSIGPLGVTLWFIILLASLASLLACGLFRIKQRSPRVQNTEEKLLQNSWRQGWIIAGAAVAILALSSLKQLTLRDAGLIIVIMVAVEIFLRSRL